MVSFIIIANFMLVATIGARSAAVVPAAPFAMLGVTADSGVADSTYAITKEQLMRYITLKKALSAYWRSHKASADSVRAIGHKATIVVYGYKFQIAMFNYPKLVKKDTAVATIFTANNFLPEQFEPMQVAVLEARSVLAATENPIFEVPKNSPTLEENVKLVKAHRDELDLFFGRRPNGTNGGGIDGGNNDLNP